jgi:general nucleoside transport system permease protein
MANPLPDIAISAGRAPMLSLLARSLGRLLLPLAGAVLALAIGAVLIALAGVDPIRAYGVMLRGAFGGARQWTETLLQATPLLIIGLGLTVAFRSRVWNIGAEGQYYIGALFGSIVGLTFTAWPSWLLVPGMLLAGLVGGLLWSSIAGLLHVRRGMNVIISTLLLNYVAILFVQYMVRVPLRDPQGFLPQTARFVRAAQMPTIFGTRLHIGVLIAILLVGLIYLFLWRTPWGFRLRAVGSSASVARAVGISVPRNILVALAASGALAGMAGIIEVSHAYGRLGGAISGGYGFSAILVALLGGLQPVGVLVAAVLFSALTIGAEALHVSLQVPSAVAQVIQALVVLFVIGGNALTQRGSQ